MRKNLTRSAGHSVVWAWVILLLPLLARYQIFDGRLDLDVVVMGLFSVGLLLTRRVRLGGFAGIHFLVVYTVFITAINLIYGTRFAELPLVVLRAGRYLFYILVTFYLCLDEVFEYAAFMRVYRAFAYAVFVYILIQMVVYFATGLVLPSKLGDAAVARLPGADGFVRMSSFFKEPAEMAYSMIPFICVSLFGENYRARDTRLFDALTISAAVTISTSGQGVLCAAALWAVWIVTGVVRERFSARYLFIILAIAGMVFALWTLGFLDATFGRLLETGKYDPYQARASGYETLRLLPSRQLVFGAGYGNYVTENLYRLDVPFENVNYSSFADALFTTGIVGTSLFILLLLRGFRCGTVMQKMMVVATLALSCGGCPWSGKTLPLYGSLIFASLGEWRRQKIASKKTVIRRRGVDSSSLSSAQAPYPSQCVPSERTARSFCCASSPNATRSAGLAFGLRRGMGK